MSDLQSLAKKKAEAKMQRNFAVLSKTIEAIKNEGAGKGNLLSGATLKRVLTACKQATDTQCHVVIAEYRWAIEQAVFASQSWVDRLVLDAIQSLEPLHVESEKHIRKVCLLIDKSELANSLVSDLKTTEIAAANDIALALKSSFAERSSGLVKSIFGFFPRLLSRLFGGGAA